MDKKTIQQINNNFVEIGLITNEKLPNIAYKNIENKRLNSF